MMSSDDPYIVRPKPRPRHGVAIAADGPNVVISVGRKKATIVFEEALDLDAAFRRALRTASQNAVDSKDRT